jgi:hypothetical protein
MESQTITLAETHGTESVLEYAIQQRRWERGVLWLVGIVCVTQLLTLPAGACELLQTVRWWKWKMGGGYGGWTGDISNGLLMLRPVGSLFTAANAFLVLMGVQWARTALKVCVRWMLLLVFGILIASAVTGRLSTMLEAPDEYFENHSLSLLFAIGYTILFCYPLVLVSVVLPRKDPSQRRLGAWGIWWLSASACLLIAAPTVADWVADPEMNWIKTAQLVFSPIVDSAWWKTFRGVGMISGAAACFSVLPAILWTLYRGSAGRWALMIAACLWVVYAAGFHGTLVPLGIYEDLFWSFPYPVRAGYVDPGIYTTAWSLREFSLWMAFPLAIRVALSLSDVREKLDGNAGRASILKRLAKTFIGRGAYCF